MPLDPFKNLILTPDLLRLVGEIDEFKGAWKALGTLAPDRLATLRHITTVESVGASTRIEGARLTDRDVDVLLANLDLGSFRTRDEQEVAGYAEATKLVFDSWREIPLTENHIKQLHGILLRFSPRDEYHRGTYKTVPNNVEAFDEHGRSVGVIFETATPSETPRLMEELAAWTNRELGGKTHHPLLVVAVFIVRFLAIHPFQDGNGRLARVLTNLLLLRTGYTYVPYSSLERVVEENREQYYRALRSAQGTLDKDESHLMELVTFFPALSHRTEKFSRRKSEAGTADDRAFYSGRAVASVSTPARPSHAHCRLGNYEGESEHFEVAPSATRPKRPASTSGTGAQFMVRSSVIERVRFQVVRPGPACPWRRHRIARERLCRPDVWVHTRSDDG